MLQNRQDFEQEAKILKKLRNPHVISYFGLYQTKVEQYLVMEYCEHRSLDVYQRASPLSQDQKLEMYFLDHLVHFLQLAPNRFWNALSSK